MDLPSDIEKQILDYLHLEYGENPNDSSSLKLSDIQFENVYEINGVSIHYFAYPSRSGRAWATVEPFGDSYVLGMTSNIPTPITKKDLYNYVLVEDFENNFKQSYELEKWGQDCFGFSDFKEIQLPNRKIQLLVEVSSHSSPTGVTLSVLDGKNDIYIRGSVGLALSYETEGVGSLSVTIGTGPWE